MQSQGRHLRPVCAHTQNVSVHTCHRVCTPVRGGRGRQLLAPHPLKGSGSDLKDAPSLSCKPRCLAPSTSGRRNQASPLPRAAGLHIPCRPQTPVGRVRIPLKRGGGHQELDSGNRREGSRVSPGTPPWQAGRHASPAGLSTAWEKGGWIPAPGLPAQSVQVEAQHPHSLPAVPRTSRKVSRLSLGSPSHPPRSKSPLSGCLTLPPRATSWVAEGSQHPQPL